MRAAVWTRYGPPEVLQLGDIDKPVPKDNELLIRVAAATVNAGDCEIRGLGLPLWLRAPMRLYAGWTKPKRITVLGQELSGEVVSVGAKVTSYLKGDEVIAATGFGFGAYAEYTCISETEIIVNKPSTITYEEAATMPVGGLNAAYFLRKAEIQRGQRILINGACGSIGTIAVQLAKHLGAEVTAVDRGDKLHVLRSIGADHVIDYTEEDFTRGNQQYDCIFDVVGTAALRRCIRILSENGTYVNANPTFTTPIKGLWFSIVRGRKVVAGVAEEKADDLVYLGRLVEEGHIKPTIDRIFGLEEIADAHRYVESGAKAGNVVIRVS